MTAPRFNRYVALGDSFTEGVGDLDPTRPNGVRGWADRVAEVLAAPDPGFRYANLAVRGRQLRAILAEQLAPALAMDPDLVTIYAGANDILRATVDLDNLVAAYDAGVEALAATGARILMWTAYDPGHAPVLRTMRGRFATYNELVREVADAHGATVVDFWRMREYRDPRMWDTDRIHMSPLGHARMAMAVLDALGVDHGLVHDVLDPLPEVPRREAREATLAWLRGFALPWVGRRLRGTSSGDDLVPRRPDLGPL
jgi:lysophospholipase L1-like esterase